MNDTTSFAIKTDAFEGPLELLLDLIEKRKLLINDISLAEVTDEYMAHVADMQEEPQRNMIGETAHFVLVASTLLLIKSKSLLPVLDLTQEEEASIEELEYRLKLYQTFRNISRDVHARFGVRVLHGCTFMPQREPLFTPDVRTTIPELSASIHEVISRLPKKEINPEVAVRTVVSLEETIGKLHERIAHQFRFGFKDFAGDTSERGTVIISFLAVLELVKQGILMARQESHFTDIEIERENVDLPRYM